MHRKSDNPVREHKSVQFELESVNDEGEFTGYASVFGNIDGGGDIVERGAFSDTIKEDFNRIKILSQHNDSDLPIGKPLELREDSKGLFIRAKISDTQKGHDIHTLMKDGVLNELSIGYDVIDFDYDCETGIRRLKKLKLWEISVVTWAMNEQAKVDSVKSFAEPQVESGDINTLFETLRLETRDCKMTQSKLNALKPFIAVVKELAEILSPFLDTAPAPNNEPAAGQKARQTKKSDMVFEIISNNTKK